MLHIYDDIKTWQLDACDLVARIRVHDRDLASQLRRSAQSVALNVAEGMNASGAVRRNCYAIALREARECMGVLDIVTAWRYVDAVSDAVIDRLDKIIATLWKLVQPR